MEGKDMYTYFISLEDVLSFLSKNSKKARIGFSENGFVRVSIPFEDILPYIAENILFGEYKETARKLGLEIEIKDIKGIYTQVLVSSHGYWADKEIGIEAELNLLKRNGNKRERIDTYKLVLYYGDRSITLYRNISEDPKEILEKKKKTILGLLKEAKYLSISDEEMSEFTKCYQNPDYPATIRELCEQKIADYIIKISRNQE